jgi:hypothetical protein
MLVSKFKHQQSEAVLFLTLKSIRRNLPVLANSKKACRIAPAG